MLEEFYREGGKASPIFPTEIRQQFQQQQHKPLNMTRSLYQPKNVKFFFKKTFKFLDICQRLQYSI